MSKIPTAKEFFELKASEISSRNKDLGQFIYDSDLQDFMVEFAKLHVKAALEEAKNNLRDGYVTDEHEEIILNCYNDSNIK